MDPRDLLLGFATPPPGDAPPHARRLLALWRAAPFVVAVYGVAGGLVVAAAGAAALAFAEDLTRDPWIVLLTLGFILIVAAVATVVGAALAAAGVAMVLLAVPLALALSWSYARAVRGEAGAVGWGIGLLAAGSLVSLAVGLTAAGATAALGVGLLVLAGALVPPAALVLLASRRTRDYLRSLGGSAPAVATPPVAR